MSKEIMMGTLKHNIVALPVILLKINISLIISKCMKVILYQKVDMLCIWCAVGLCRTYAWTKYFFEFNQAMECSE